MTVTQKPAEANYAEESAATRPWPKAWANNTSESCWRTMTRYKNGRYYQVSTSCKRLECEECGPRIKLRDYEEAVVRHAMEDQVWVVLVDSSQVDKLRKQAARRDQPIESIPVAGERNAVISPYRFDGAEEYSQEEMRRLFLIHRISKRKHTRNGRWRRKPLPKAKEEGITLAREYISPEAFDNVAASIGAKVVHYEHSRYFDDDQDRDPEWFKKEFIKEEMRLRKKRLAERAAR